MSYIRSMTDDAFADVPERQSLVKPYVFSHGTLECKSLAASRKFYEEFLGLECAQHGASSMVIRCGVKFHVVCVQMGDAVRPCHLHNHWGVDVASKEEVDAAYQAALQYKDEYGIKEIMAPDDRHGVYSFYLEDLDSNWWEVQYYQGYQNDDMFDFGDRFTPDGKPVSS